MLIVALLMSVSLTIMSLSAFSKLLVWNQLNRIEQVAAAIELTTVVLVLLGWIRMSALLTALLGGTFLIYSVFFDRPCKCFGAIRVSRIFRVAMALTLAIVGCIALSSTYGPGKDQTALFGWLVGLSLASVWLASRTLIGLRR